MKRLFVLTFSVMMMSAVYAQKTSSDKAVEILDKAIAKAFESENVSIQFEGIAYGVDNPVGIFDLPVYKVVRGGYLYMDKDKYEMQLGSMKSLSNGKLVVVIDEVSKMMYVDSVRKTSLYGEAPDVDPLLAEAFGDGKLSYIGEEMIKGKRYHKIRSDITGGQGASHVFYWVDINTGQLFLMSEFQNGAYDVYWIKSVGKAPANYDYTINLPKRELESYAGYEVVDQRFVSEDVFPKTKPDPKIKRK